MAGVCFTAAYSQTSQVTGIPVHGTHVWPRESHAVVNGNLDGKE